MPLVSVIVVNWDRRELLRACLLALRAQTFRDFETIVVDNGSTDGSPELVAAEFPEARLLRNAENRGFCAANNQGIRAAAGRYVALLNNDAEPAPGWLQQLLRGLEAGPGVAMCASKILFHEARDVIDKAGHVIYLDGQNRGRGCGQRDRGQFDRIEEVLFPDGCAALYDRAAVEAAGLFDEDFFAYGDDAELGLRLRLAGWRSIYVPTAVVYHHHSSTLGRFSEERLVLVERNRLWLAVKLFPVRLLLLNPFFTLARVACNGWAALRGRGEAGRFAEARGWRPLVRSMVRAWIAALGGLPRMLRKRRAVRAALRASASSRVRPLSNREFVALLRRHRIGACELAGQAAPLPTSVQAGTA